MNYFAKPGQSSGKLSTFHNSGNRCPDLVLEQERLDAANLFWIPPFETGNIFEALVQDIATGSDTFSDSFFRSDVKSVSFADANSTASKIVWTQKYHAGDRFMFGEFLENITKKDGDPYKGTESTHALVEECIDHPDGKLPVTRDDYADLKELAEKTLAMPLPSWWETNPNLKFVGDFLGHSMCKFQEELYWSRNGILKKGKTDCLIVHEHGAAIIDLKWSATEPNFLGRLKSKYCIQAQHYQEGVSETYGVPCLPMLFVAGIKGDKNTPSMPTALAVEDMTHTDRDWCSCSSCRLAKYEQICREYHIWEVSGRRSVGYLPGRKVRVWM